MTVLRPISYNSTVFRAAIPTLLLAALAFQVGSFIVLHSNTVDEMAYVGSGAAYVHSGRLDIDIFEHPPLMKYLIGVALLPISTSYPLFPDATKLGSYKFGYRFIYHHPTASPELIMALARLPNLLVSLALAVFVFLWASHWFGEWGGICALAAYCFEPNLIAQSGLATFDLGMSAFLLAATYFLVVWREEGKPWQAITAGVLAGCGVVTKIPGLIFFVWAPILLRLGPKPSQKATKALPLILLGAAVVVLATYQLRFLPAFTELFRYRLEQTFFAAKSDLDPVFLHGAIRPGGWRYYLLVTFLVKTAVPFLLLIVGAGVEMRDKRRLMILSIPVLVYFAVASLSSKEGGIRYLLPIFPFLCVLIGGLGQVRGGWKRGATAALFGWCALECFAVYPHYLGYFNELSGGSSNGYKWFWDSNVDWGQDFPMIGRYLKTHGSPEVIVASGFNASRDYYIGTRQDLVSAPGSDEDFRHINSPNPARELFVISAAVEDGLIMNDPNTFNWIRSRKPIDRIGYTTFVYDVTRDAASHYFFGLIYRNNKRYDFALREFRRTEAIAPGNPLVSAALRETKNLMKAHGAS